MSDLLSPDQAGQLALLNAITTDEGNRTRIGTLLKAQAAAEAAQAAAQEAAEVAKDHADAAQAALAEASRIKAATAQRSDELDAREHGMAEVLTSLNTEKAAFEKVRAEVEADQAAREQALSAREAEVGARQQVCVEEMAQLASDQIGVARLKSELEAKHERLHAALVENRAEAPADAT